MVDCSLRWSFWKRTWWILTSCMRRSERHWRWSRNSSSLDASVHVQGCWNMLLTWVDFESNPFRPAISSYASVGSRLERKRYKYLDEASIYWDPFSPITADTQKVALICRRRCRFTVHFSCLWPRVGTVWGKYLIWALIGIDRPPLTKYLLPFWFFCRCLARIRRHPPTPHTLSVMLTLRWHQSLLWFAKIMGRWCWNHLISTFQPSIPKQRSQQWPKSCLVDCSNGY